MAKADYDKLVEQHQEEMVYLQEEYEYVNFLFLYRIRFFCFGELILLFVFDSPKNPGSSWDSINRQPLQITCFDSCY